MYFFLKQIAILLIVVACCTLTISCSDSRAVQCTKFTEIVTKGKALIDIKKDSYDAATTKNLAKDLKQISKQLEALQITDTTLKEIQGPSVKSFREMGQALGDTGKALEAGNLATTSIEGREQIKTAIANMSRAKQQVYQAANNQEALTGKLINYCKSDR
jgi:cytochrome c556